MLKLTQLAVLDIFIACVQLYIYNILLHSHNITDMTESLKLDSADIIRLRCKRLVELGKTLTEKYPR